MDQTDCNTVNEDQDKDIKDLITKIEQNEDSKLMEIIVKSYTKKMGLTKAVKAYLQLEQLNKKKENNKMKMAIEFFVGIFSECGFDMDSNLLMQAINIENPTEAETNNKKKKETNNKGKRKAPPLEHVNKKKRSNEDDPNLPLAIRRKNISRQILDSNEVPKGWYLLQKTETFPKIKVFFGEKDGLEIKEKINKFFDENPIKVGIMKRLYLKKDHIDVMSTDIKEAEKVYKSIKENFKEVTVKWNAPSDPVIRIVNVKMPEGLNKEDFVKQIKFLNDWPDSANVMVTHWSSFKNSTIYAVSLQVSPGIRTQLEDNKGVIKFNGKLHKAADCFNIKLCKKCYVFGHWTGECNQQTRCPCCSKCHRPPCDPNGDKAGWFCQECRVAGHSVMSRSCPRYIQKLNNLISEINYSYQWIMAPPSKFD